MKLKQKRVIFFLILILFAFVNLKPVFAETKSINCDNRYITLVNPVRDISFWKDKDSSSLEKQYSAIKQWNLAASWLLQYNVLSDQKLMSTIKSFDSKQEKGIFLEVSPKLAQKARVIYPVYVSWYYPNAIFLSGYSQSDRIKLINEVFTKFKEENGYFPKSVGAWWIDSFSLNYMREKFGITSAMIVADQKNTDRYGISGQWWGVPYYPSKANILSPASDLKNKQDVLIIQWAQRDLSKAYGIGPMFSNFSLQANDYITQGKDINYFDNLAKAYLDCNNALGQITVGLETGVVSKEYLNEYEKQINELTKYKNLKFVSMSQLAYEYKRVYLTFPKQVTIADGTSTWYLTDQKRTNDYLKDKIYYNQNQAFSDYFVKDESSFLNRILSSKISSNKEIYSGVILLLAFIGSFLLFKHSKKTYIWVLAIIFILGCFGSLLRSNYEFGWFVFYGPIVENLLLVQAGSILISFGTFYVLSKKFREKILLFVSLSFAMDFLISLPRYIQLDKNYYFGVSVDALRFFGITFSKTSINIVNKDLLFYQASSLLKFNFDKIWNNLWISFILYPLGHFLIGIIIYFCYQRIPLRLKKPFIAIIAILYLGWIFYIFNLDPRAVKRF